MTCRSCHWSRMIDGATRPVLWCVHPKLDRPARSRCSLFVYEPGTDEGAE